MKVSVPFVPESELFVRFCCFRFRRPPSFRGQKGPSVALDLADIILLSSFRYQDTPSSFETPPELAGEASETQKNKWKQPKRASSAPERGFCLALEAFQL